MANITIKLLSVDLRTISMRLSASCMPVLVAFSLRVELVNEKVKNLGISK